MQHLADQQQSLLDQLMAVGVQTSQQLWDHVAQVVRPAPAGVVAGGSEASGQSGICIPKLASKDDPEVFLNLFEWSAQAAVWPENQCVVILIPCWCVLHSKLCIL